MRRIGRIERRRVPDDILVRAKATTFVSHHHADKIDPSPRRALECRALFGMLVPDGVSSSARATSVNESNGRAPEIESKICA